MHPEPEQCRDLDGDENTNGERVGVGDPQHIASAGDHDDNDCQCPDVERACGSAEPGMEQRKRVWKKTACGKTSKRPLGAAQSGVEYGNEEQNDRGDDRECSDRVQEGWSSQMTGQLGQWSVGCPSFVGRWNQNGVGERGDDGRNEPGEQGQARCVL